MKSFKMGVAVAVFLIMSIMNVGGTALGYSGMRGNTVIYPDDSFSDVDQRSLFLESIHYAKDNGIVQGYADGTFKPYNSISRAEFTKVITYTLFGEDEVNGCDLSTLGFLDVKTDDWYAKSICIAQKEKLVSGYGDKTFRPNNEINFVEAAKIIVEAYSNASDLTEGPEWYEKYTRYLSDHGAIPVSIGIFPDKKINRAEMVEIMMRLELDIRDLESVNLYPDTGDWSVEDLWYEGYLHLQEQSIDTARVFFEAALLLDNNYAPALSSYGNVVGRNYEGREVGELCLLKSIEIDPSWTFSYYNLALFYGENQQRDKQYEYYVKLLQACDNEVEGTEKCTNYEYYQQEARRYGFAL